MLSFLSFLDPLVDPTFINRDDPPLKVNLSAKMMGMVTAILSALGLLALLAILPFALGAGAIAGAMGINTFHPILFIGILITIGGGILSLVGGYQMYQENRDGKRLLIYGLAVYALGDVVDILGGQSSQLLSLIILAALYYFVVISRWPDEAPLSATAPPPSGPPTV